MRHIQGHYDCLFSNSVHVFVRPGELIQINDPNISNVLPHVLTVCCVNLGLTVEVKKKYYKYVSVTSFFVSMRKGNISSHLIAESAEELQNCHGSTNNTSRYSKCLLLHLIVQYLYRSLRKSVPTQYKDFRKNGYQSVCVNVT